MTAYFIGDIPAEDLAVVPTRAGNLTDLALFETATVRLFNFVGTSIPTTGFTATVEADQVVIEWPDTSVFATDGLYNLSLTLAGPGVQETADDIQIVVQQRDGWHTLDSARREIDGNAPADDARLFMLLHIAKVACIEYLDDLYLGTPEFAWRQAQLMQARNILNAQKTDPAQSPDGSVYTLRPYPLDKFIRNILRPPTGLPEGF